MSDWQWKNEIKKRDGYVCRRCGFDKNLHVHHILPKDKYPYEKNYPPNGLTLCGNCHVLLKDKEDQTDLRGFLPDDLKIDEQLKYINENASLVNKNQRILLTGRKSQRVNKLVKDKFRRANELSDRGEYKEAVVLYDDAILLKSDFVVAYYYRGKVKCELKRYKAAIYDYNKALCLKPDYVRAYFDRGRARYSLGQYKSMITDYDMVLLFTRDNVRAYFNRGLAKYKLKQYDAAIADFDEAINRKPDFTSAYCYRGLAKYEQELYDAAIADFVHVIRLDPNYKKDSPNLKLANCESAIKYNLKDALTFYYRGNANAELGQHDAARISYDTAKQLDPNIGCNALLQEIFQDDAKLA